MSGGIHGQRLAGQASKRPPVLTEATSLRTEAEDRAALVATEWPATTVAELFAGQRGQ
jgi:hypothetical protein